MGSADSPYIRGVGRGVGHPISVLFGSVASYICHFMLTCGYTFR